MLQVLVMFFAAGLFKPPNYKSMTQRTAAQVKRLRAADMTVPASSYERNQAGQRVLDLESLTAEAQRVARG
jgi:hypothetical protein